MLYPGAEFPSAFARAVREAEATGDFVFDAMIVAVCRETGVDELLTEDVDFRRFRAFRTVSLKEFGRRAGRGSRP